MRNGNHNSEQVETKPADATRKAECVDSSRGPRRKASEDGYGLLTVIFLLTIMTLWMSVAVPKMTRSIQRDHELETMHRGKQYIRAVQLYYRKFHAYAPSMDALVKTNEIRFLRKKYIDPMTGKDDWKPLMFGQNKAPTVMGFFGQALATGSTLAGIGMSGGNGVSGLGGANGSQNAAGTLGSIFNSQQGTGSTTTQNPTTGPGATGTDGSGSSTGTDASGGTGATDSNGNPIPGGGTNGLSSTGATAGQTFGGAGIIGVTPASPKPSLLVYKKKTHYNEWEFDYDPAMEMMMQGGNTGMIGTPAGGMSSPIGGSGFGSTTNTFGGGQTGSTPFSAPGAGSQPNSPTSPQQ
jgi:hypothetical protein